MPDMITLYHGTTHDFTVIDVQKGKPFKDFGQGFYLAESNVETDGEARTEMVTIQSQGQIRVCYRKTIL